MSIDAASQGPKRLPLGNFRTIVDLAMPAIAENLLTTLVLFANTILIGWLRDDTALAAMGLSNSFLWIANGLFQALGIATTAMVARFVGKGDTEASTRVLSQSLFVGALTALAITAIGTWLSDSLLVFMGAEPEVVAQGGRYMRIVLATSVLAFPLMVAAGAMRGAGDMRTPLWISLVANVWNVGVGYLLIFGPGPFPALRLAGAAAATSSARALGGLLALAVLVRGRTALRLEPRSLLHWDGDLVRRIVRVALPNLGETAVDRVGSILFMRIVTALGTAALAAHQIAVRVESLSFMATAGFMVVAATLVGQSLGAGRPDIAEQSIRRVLLLACGLAAAAAACFALFGRQMVVIFGASPEVLRLAGVALQIGALEQLSLAVQLTLAGAQRGAGDTRTPLYVTMFGVLFFRVVLVYLFAIVLDLGLAGVWWGTVVDWAGRAALMVVLFRRGRWKGVRV